MFEVERVVGPCIYYPGTCLRPRSGAIKSTPRSRNCHGKPLGSIVRRLVISRRSQDCHRS